MSEVTRRADETIAAIDAAIDGAAPWAGAHADGAPWEADAMRWSSGHLDSAGQRRVEPDVAALVAAFAAAAEPLRAMADAYAAAAERFGSEVARLAQALAPRLTLRAPVVRIRPVTCDFTVVARLPTGQQMGVARVRRMGERVHLDDRMAMTQVSTVLRSTPPRVPDAPVVVETPGERALRLRRERNTGPRRDQFARHGRAR